VLDSDAFMRRDGFPGIKICCYRLSRYTTLKGLIRGGDKGVVDKGAFVY
jgi:hypothetical protein